MALDPGRTVAELKELRALTGDANGAQRVCWTDTWLAARAWLREKLEAVPGVAYEVDEAGNAWATLRGASDQAVLIGGHIDSVPNGGWLDGCLNLVAGLEVLRRLAAEAAASGTPPPVTLRVVDWADEEGARFGRSLTGSAASAGTLDAAKELAHLVDRAGIKLPDALRENGVSLDRMGEAHAWLKERDPRAYLELHIEQGPVLEAMKKPVGVVLGTMGVERHMVRFIGQAVHAGATPIPLRKDAFLAAAEFALACRDIGLKFSGRTPKKRVVATCGVVKVEPGFVTAVSGLTDISLDLRALDGDVLARMQAAAVKAARAAAKKNRCAVEWSPLLSIAPRPFDEHLLDLCAAAVREVAGDAPKLPSGPLHDAAEMAGIMPTVMVFAQSSPGISHTRLEDTPIPHLDKSIRAFLRLVETTIDHVADAP